MFGSKKDKGKSKKDEYSDLQSTVIPDVFYGGQDPFVYHPHIEENSSKTDGGEINNKKQKISKPTTPKQKHSNRKVWIFGSIGFVLAAGLISWYYINDFNKSNIVPIPQNTKSSPIVIIENNNTTTTPETIVTTVVEETTSTIELPTSTPSLQNVFLDFPPILTLDTADIDADSLTDIEEEIFNTDSGRWDTDDDRYYDGQEVYNLYNPKGLAPVKIIDSGLVLEYKNLYSSYRIYYPTAWQKGSVDTQETQVLFSASNGDYIEVRVFQKESGQTFVNWFSRYAEGQSYSDLISFKNRFDVDAMIRKDNLVAYFEDTNFIYTIIYHTKDRGPIRYRHVMQMMYQSFRMSNTSAILPDQIVYPSTESASSTNISTSSTGGNN
ncbi:MAG: hypothetical protein WC025_01220 [Candidatus Magasanikbacteria bacterium]